MEQILNLLGGGVLGALTSIVNGWFKMKDEKDKREFQLRLIKANSEAAVIEAKAQLELQRSVTEGEIAKAEMAAEAEEMHGRNQIIERLTGNYIGEATLNKMIADDSIVGKIFRPIIYLHVLFMDAIRGIIRPAVTAGSIGFSFYVFIVSFEYLQKLGGITDAKLILDNVTLPMVNLLLFLVSAAAGFWFADKSGSRRFQVGNKNA